MSALASLLGERGRLIGAGIVGVIILSIAAWGWRVDNLRADYRAQLESIAETAGSAAGGGSPPLDRIQSTILGIAGKRDQFLRERDGAVTALSRQTASIRALEREGQRLTAASNRNREIAAGLIRERDHWIAEARRAETRAERLSCERELEEVNATLDVLYRAGL